MSTRHTRQADRTWIASMRGNKGKQVGFAEPCTNLCGLVFMVSFISIFWNGHMFFNTTFEEKKEAYFRIEIPVNFVIVKTTPVEDFDIFSIGLPGKEYVKIYVGNHPTFPNMKGDESHIARSSETSDVKIVSVWEGNTLIAKEMLIIMPTDSWPKYIHAWTNNLPPEEFILADQIIMSLKAR